MKHNEDGRLAEDAVAHYLKAKGYKIRERNWQTPKCEIDIVAEKADCLFFVEVKFRSSNSQGDGFEYITSAKIKQMSYAADLWVAKNRWEGEYVLSGASVAGSQYRIDFREEIVS